MEYTTEGPIDPEKQDENEQVCTDCGIAKHHTEEQCTQIRIAKAVLAEVEWWEADAGHELTYEGSCGVHMPSHCQVCIRKSRAERNLKLAESLGQQ